MEAPATNRLKLTVHYDGSQFHGWQLQPDRRTVQGDLEAAVSRLADSPRTVLASGRTDTGVHATGQVAAVDMPPGWSSQELQRSLNAVLPGDIWIEQVDDAAPDFHPRYDAIDRTYGYHVGLAPESHSPFHHRWCWPLCEPLDRDLLDTAAAAVVGEHSFRAFSKAGQPQRGDRCTVSDVCWTDNSLGVELSITADRYLHRMVRYLVGTMVDVARGRRPVEDIARLLADEGGLTTSPPAPAQGLFLRRVTYPATTLRTRTSAPFPTSTATA